MSKRERLDRGGGRFEFKRTEGGLEKEMLSIDQGNSRTEKRGLTEMDKTKRWG